MAQAARKDEPTHEDRVAAELRQLALVDRIIGLEAELAQLSISGGSSETERLQGELRAVYASRTWKLGSLVVSPARALRSVVRGRTPR